MGKSGVVDLDEAGVGTGKLLNATAGVLDIFGSHSDNCSVLVFQLDLLFQVKVVRNLFLVVLLVMLI